MKRVPVNDGLSQTLTAGAGYGEPILVDGPCTVSAIPGSGGTMDVQFTTSPRSALAASAVWQDWPAGAVSSTTNDALLTRVAAVRAKATTADGVLEVFQ